MNTNITLLLLLILAPFIGLAQTDVEKQIAQVENGLLPTNIIEGEEPYNLEERMKFYQVPGISITVINNFEVDWTRHYGVSDQELKTPVTDQTIFNVGSLSKGMASLTALSLVQKGLYDLEEDVNLKLKSWKIPQNEFSKDATISPKLLMNHSSGAMHHYGLNYTRDQFPTITQYLKGETPARERPTIIDRTPGTEFLYSNPGFAILQQYVEDITSKRFHVTAQKNVFDILSMPQTTFEQPLPHEKEKVASAGHRQNSSPLPVKRYYYPNTAAGGLWSTTADFAKYVIELQKSYHGKSNKIISQELAREMMKTHISPQYGLGLFIRKQDNETYFSHMGDNAGFFAGFISHISDGYGVVVFTNSNTSPELIREINKAVAKTYKWEGFLPDSQKTVEISDEVKRQISGRYKTGSDRVVNIIYEDGDLLLSSMGNARMFHIGDNTFIIQQRNGELTFTRGRDGKFTRAEYAFADQIGRISNQKSIAKKMKPGEKIPVEYIEAGEFEEAAKMYRKIYQENPTDNSVSENRLNRLGYQYIGQKKYEQALAVFKLNVEFYPESANCYDSYGEALALTGKTNEAIKNYKKTLELDPDSQNARKMIQKLQKE